MDDQHIITLTHQGKPLTRIAPTMNLTVHQLYTYLAQKPDLRDQVIRIREEVRARRPQRILTLFRQGLSARDVAEEIGIGLGTLRWTLTEDKTLAAQVNQAITGHLLARYHQIAELVAHHGQSLTRACINNGVHLRQLKIHMGQDHDLQRRIHRAQNVQRTLGGSFVSHSTHIIAMAHSGYDDESIADHLGLSLGVFERLCHAHDLTSTVEHIRASSHG